ncbi:MAG: hypothetical protein JXR78_15775 [Victivallales bacterium]|nr:hypothetical protein [Victivallales bacterium]
MNKITKGKRIFFIIAICCIVFITIIQLCFIKEDSKYARNSRIIENIKKQIVIYYDLNNSLPQSLDKLNLTNDGKYSAWGKEIFYEYHETTYILKYDIYGEIITIEISVAQ